MDVELSTAGESGVGGAGDMACGMEVHSCV